MIDPAVQQFFVEAEGVRQRLQITIKELTKRLGVGYSTYQQWRSPKLNRYMPIQRLKEMQDKLKRLSEGAAMTMRITVDGEGYVQDVELTKTSIQQALDQLIDQRQEVITKMDRLMEQHNALKDVDEKLQVAIDSLRDVQDTLK